MAATHPTALPRNAVSRPLSGLLVGSTAPAANPEASHRFPVHARREELQSYAEMSVGQLFTIHYFRLRPELAGARGKSWLFFWLPSASRQHASPMGADVDGHRLIGNQQLFGDHQAYGEGHRDALLISSIQAHWATIYLRDGPCRWHGAVRIVQQSPSHRFPSTVFFLIHCLIRLHHQFTERNGTFGIEPRHSDGEG